MGQIKYQDEEDCLRYHGTRHWSLIILRFDNIFLCGLNDGASWAVYLAVQISERIAIMPSKVYSPRPNIKLFSAYPEPFSSPIMSLSFEREWNVLGLSKIAPLPAFILQENLTRVYISSG